ncbi:MAG: glycosyltransferase [Pseudorhodobacter sp.]
MRPPACLLDVTRVMSCLGRGPLTGVDRVESAWLAQLCAGTIPAFGLARTRAGALLLDAEGLDRLRLLLATPGLRGKDLPPPDLLSRLTCRNDAQRARAETALRRLSCARAPVVLLSRLLRCRLPAGFAALNTGHANLSNSVMRALRQGGAGKIAVLIHDTIPLDHPEYTRPDIPPVFARKLAATAAHADLVIHTANATRAATETHFTRLGRVPPGVTAPLGLDLAAPDPDPPRPIPTDRPYFVTLGTIEPRKNHAFLLDLWETMLRDPPQQMPALLILGRRGWSNEAVFRRLDDPGPLRGHVFELPDIADSRAMGLLAASRGLLFPSLAEGYGLPPLEAAALGVPAILPPLPVYRETLGDYPVYHETSDVYAWMETIGALTANPAKPTLLPSGGLPDWVGHCNRVLSLLG